MIDVRQLRLLYGELPALDGIDVSIAEHEVVALVGASGSGKSSLLYCMSGLLTPTSGTVTVNGTDLTRLRSESLATFRRRNLGFVFQFAELVPELTLRQNIALPLELNGHKPPAVRHRTEALIAQLGLGDRADARPAHVSGGQAQRAAVARAIAHEPAVLFADEPTGALDSSNADAVLNLMLQLARDNGTTVVLVTHDEKVAAAADRTIALADGRVPAALRPTP